MNKEEILGAFSLVNNPIVLSEEEVKDVQKAIKQLQKENQKLKKQYCERTDCSGRLGNSKKVDQLEKELEQLKEIEKEHQRINGDLRIEIKELQQENQKYKEVIDRAIKCIDYSTKYRNGADIYQFVDIESEILGPLKDILEQNEENGNAYLKEFNDWLKEVE